MTGPAAKNVSLILGTGIFFFPYLFAWKLLQAGYSKAARAIGFGWMAVCLLVVLDAFNKTEHNAGVSTSAKGPSISAAKPVAPPTEVGGATASKAASVAEVDPATERAKNRAVMEEIQKRLIENQKQLTKFYATAREVKRGSEDHEKLVAIALSRGLSKHNDDLKQAAQAKVLASRTAEQVREMYASSMEEGFIKSGMDVRVRAIGKGKERMTITYALMSQPLVYKFQNEMKLPAQAGGFGFKRLVYTNGFESSLGQSWTVDL